MSIRRAVVMVVGTALALAMGYHYGSDLYFGLASRPFIRPTPTEPKPLAGKNFVSNLKVRETSPGVWVADFDYFYTGVPAWAGLRIDLGGASGSSDGNVGPENLQTSLPRPERGGHHVTHQITPGANRGTVGHGEAGEGHHAG